MVRGYRSELFREDLKKLYEKTGVENTDTVFVFNDTQVIEPSFLEDINGMLTSGEVSNLYPPDELSTVRGSVRNDVRAAGMAETNDVLWNYFVERVRARPSFRMRTRAAARTARASSRRSGSVAEAASGTSGGVAPAAASSATNCSTLRRIECQRFLMARSVRPRTPPLRSTTAAPFWRTRR